MDEHLALLIEFRALLAEYGALLVERIHNALTNKSYHTYGGMDESRHTCLVGARVCHTYGEVMSHKWRSHVTHMNDSCDTYRVMDGSSHTHEIIDEPWHTYLEGARWNMGLFW